MNPKQRVQLLLATNEILRGSLDLAESFPKLAAALVGSLVDWCVLDVLQEGGRLGRVGAAHGDPARHRLASRLLGVFDLDGHGPWGPAQALRTRHMLYFPRIQDPALVAPKGETEQLAVVSELGLGAVACIPMVVGAGEAVGVLTAGRAPSNPTFTPNDLATLRTIARRAADSVVHAQLLRQAQAANRAKDEFMAMLGHELRNPIAGISNAVRVLERLGTADATVARLHAIIARQVGHLGRLVEDLLDVTRLTSGKVVLRLEPVDLREVAERGLAALETGGAQRDIALDVDADAVVVSGDPFRLDQILGNLLENAVKYTPGGGRIEVRVRRDGQSAVLTVRDTGVGIPPELLPRVFDLFAQGQSPPNPGSGGLGIGLTLVRRLVELHRGTVAASSPGPGQGTLVEITLPLAPAAARPAPSSVAPAAGVTPRHILLIEDHVDVRDALALLLAQDGHRVIVAATGREALDRARQAHPEVALVDIGLPGMDGYEVGRQLRALAGPPIYLVALTGYGQPTDRQRAREAGFDVHLVKPVNPEELTRILARLDLPAPPPPPDAPARLTRSPASPTLDP